MHEENSYLGVTGSFSMEFLGVVVGTVLCILQGTGVIDIGWFWATFPFWILIAVDAVIITIVLLIIFIVTMIADRDD